MTTWARDFLHPYGREELNLIEVSWTLLKKGLGHKEVKMKHWTVSTTKAELPGPKTLEVYWALCALSKRQDFQDPEIRFSCRDLLWYLAWPFNGVSYRRLRTAFEDMVRVAFTCSRWFDKQTGTVGTAEFSLLDSWYIASDAPPDENQLELPLDWITWGAKFFESMKSGYLKRVNLRLLRKLRRPLARRLWQILDKRLWKKDAWTVRISLLAGPENLNMKQRKGRRRLSLTWQGLKRAADDLVKNGYLAPVEIERGPDDWKLTFRRGPRAEYWDPKPATPAPAPRRAESGPERLGADYAQWCAGKVAAALEDLDAGERADVDAQVRGLVAQAPAQCRGEKLEAAHRAQVVRARLNLPTLERWARGYRATTDPGISDK